jgi:hypothetical protein
VAKADSELLGLLRYLCSHLCNWMAGIPLWFAGKPVRRVMERWLVMWVMAMVGSAIALTAAVILILTDLGLMT